MMSHSNAWSNPSAVSAEDAARMAAFLEDRARCPDQAQVNAALRDVVSGRPGERVLEVGCGSGALCRLVSPDLRPGGEMVGVDVAPDMIAAARRYAETDPHLRFDVASGEQLPHDAATFEAAFAARLLLHVADPLAVVREMARVVKPGGRIVLMDWDWETLAVTHPDRELTRRLLHWRCDHHGGDNWSGRKLLGYLLDAGLHNPIVIPVVTLAHDEDRRADRHPLARRRSRSRSRRHHTGRARRLGGRAEATDCCGTVPGEHRVFHRARRTNVRMGEWASGRMSTSLLR